MLCGIASAKKKKAFSIFWGLNTFLVFPYKPFDFNAINLE